MTTVMEPSVPARAEIDLVEAIRDVLRASPEPLTLPRIRAALIGRHERAGLQEIAHTLERQVAAQVIFLYPKYRSGNDRYWHRPIREYIVQLLRHALANGPCSVAELRRWLPDYAKILAEPIIEEELAWGRLFAHPPLTARVGVRYGLTPPCPGPYLTKELDGVYERMSRLGFTPGQVRHALLALLQEKENWTPARHALIHYTTSDTPLSPEHNPTLIPETMF